MIVCGKDTKMSGFCMIKKRKMSIAEEKDLENALAAVEDYKAFMDYIAVCDHPEILEDDTTMEVEE